jgi:hypothetical protein
VTSKRAIVLFSCVLVACGGAIEAPDEAANEPAGSASSPVTSLEGTFTSTATIGSAAGSPVEVSRVITFDDGRMRSRDELAKVGSDVAGERVVTEHAGTYVVVEPGVVEIAWTGERPRRATAIGSRDWIHVSGLGVLRRATPTR